MIRALRRLVRAPRPRTSALPGLAVVGLALAGCGNTGRFPNELASSTEEQIERPGVHALFSLESPSVGPFPSSLFTAPDEAQMTGQRVALPKPDCAERPSDCEDIDVINSLDGFNLQPRLTISFDGQIDVQSVNNGSVSLLKFGHHVRPKLIGINQVVWDPASQKLYAESDELLDQHAQFGLLVTKGVLDLSGAPVRPSNDFSSFLRRGRGPYHAQLIRGLEAAHRVGIRTEDVVTASVFTTLSATAQLEKMRDQVKAETPAPASFIIGGTQTVFRAEDLVSMTVHQQTRVSPPGFSDSVINLSLLQYIPGTVGTIAFGRFSSPDYELPEKYIPPTGTLTGQPMVQGANELIFDLILPSGRAPENGWPVAIYGHGGGTSKEQIFILASIMAEHGFAIIAINIVGHGFGSLGTIELGLSDGQTVTFPTGGRGIDQDGDNIIDNNEGFDAVAPFKIVTNRDGLRQAVVDHLQLIREIEVGMDVDGDGKPDLDPSRIYYFGISQGGIHGTDLLAVEPSIRAGVLCFPGGPRVEFRRMSPVSRDREGVLLRDRVPRLINSPGITEIASVPVMPPYFNENKPLRNLPPVINDVVGAIEIQEVFENEEWTSQPGDPGAYAAHLLKDPLAGVPLKPVMIQFASRDRSLPNPATTAMLRAGNLAGVATYYRHDLAFAENPSLQKNPHALHVFLGTPAVAPIAAQLQEQVAAFFESDGRAIIHPEPARFFEVPVIPPLPEDIEFIP